MDRNKLKNKTNLKAKHEDLEDVHLNLSHTSDMYISTSICLLNGKTVDAIIVVMVTLICCVTISRQRIFI